MYKIIKESSLTTNQKLQYNQQKIKAYFDKSTSWSYEKVWRMIIDREFCRIYNNLIPFPYISAIYLGCNIKLSDKELILSIAKKNKIDVFEGMINNQNYKINFMPINIDTYYKYKQYELEYELSQYNIIKS